MSGAVHGGVQGRVAEGPLVARARFRDWIESLGRGSRQVGLSTVQPGSKGDGHRHVL